VDSIVVASVLVLLASAVDPVPGVESVASVVVVVAPAEPLAMLVAGSPLVSSVVGELVVMLVVVGSLEVGIKVDAPLDPVLPVSPSTGSGDLQWMVKAPARTVRRVIRDAIQIF
jgi:hypothetical protein